MKQSLIAKAEAARKQAQRGGKLQARSAQAARELRVATRARLRTGSSERQLKLDDLRALAAAARKQLGRG